ncbi:unnamed protein product [Choristocarpus tenellus]
MASPRRFQPGRILLALAALPRHVAKAFTFAGHGMGQSPQPKLRLQHSITDINGSTPPVSPVCVSPVQGDNELVSFYLLRHGETNFNAIGRIQGTLDSSRLTDQGTSQAVEAGKNLASLPDLDLGSTVVVSPMRRAQQTLACVRDELKLVGKDFSNVEIVPSIREIELFEWQGQLKDDLIKERPDQYASWVKDPANFNLDGRYPARDLWARAEKAWEEIRSLQSVQKQRKTLVVAHNAINQALLWTALGSDASLFRKISWPNCAILELQWRQGEERAERYRWVLPGASEFVEAHDAEALCKGTQDDTRFTL